MNQLLKKCVETIRNNSRASIICIQGTRAVDFEFHGNDDQLEDIIYTLAEFWGNRAKELEKSNTDKMIEDIINDLLEDDEGEEDEYE